MASTCCVLATWHPSGWYIDITSNPPTSLQDGCCISSQGNWDSESVYTWAKALQLISERAEIQPQQHLSKPQIYIPLDTEIPLLRSDPVSVLTGVQSSRHTRLLITALFVIVKS